MFSTIPTYITPVLDLLENAGFEAYLVGGCVRDSAMGKVPHDYDITTNAKPHELLRVFRDFRVIETGLKHGTLTVVSEGECVEITTYRIDGEYADNRHPANVSFTDDITLDLSRRDFTVNAMAYSRSLGLCDPFGGMDHLAKARIVCVGSPSDRFLEDGLRILRALRFASVLSFDIDGATAEAIHALSHLLRGISKERIYSELSKLLCGVGCAAILKAYADVLAVCTDGIGEDVFSDFAEHISKSPCDPTARLALLCRFEADARGVGAREVATHVMRGLKSSSADARRCAVLAVLTGEAFPESDADVKRLMGSTAPQDIVTYAQMRGVYADDELGECRFTERYAAVAEADPCVRVSQLQLTGRDVMSLTGARGEQVGAALSRLLEEVTTGHLPNERDALEEYLRRNAGDAV